MRHSQQRVVTVANDQMTYRQPIKICDLVILTAEVSFVGRTSMEVEVIVTAENPITGERTHTNTAYLVYVAFGPDGKPVPVPSLIPETDAERKRMEAGKERQAYRLAHAAAQNQPSISPEYPGP
jgi:acyl-CoA hydrolase